MRVLSVGRAFESLTFFVRRLGVEREVDLRLRFFSTMQVVLIHALACALPDPVRRLAQSPMVGAMGWDQEDHQVPLFRFNTSSPRFPAQLLAQPTGIRERGAGVPERFWSAMCQEGSVARRTMEPERSLLGLLSPDIANLL